MAFTRRAVLGFAFFAFAFASQPLFAHRRGDGGSSQNGSTASIPNCPAASNTPNFAVLDGTSSCSGLPNPLGSRVVALTDPTNTFTATITPALWINGFSGGNTILNINFKNLSSSKTLTLQSLVIGTVLNGATYVLCDSPDTNSGPGNLNNTAFCTQGLLTLPDGSNEVLQPTPITAADLTDTRWDFSNFTAVGGSISGTLSLVANCVPQEFASDYTDANGDGPPCTNSLSLPGGAGTPTEFLAVVSDGSTLYYAGTLQVPVASAAKNDKFKMATEISATPFSDVISTVGTNPQQILIGQGAGGEINSQTDPAPPCSPYPSRIFRSVWYTFTPTKNSQVNITTANSRYDTVLYVFTGPPNNPITVGCNDDATSLVESSALSFTAEAATTYNIMVSECPSDVGTILQNGSVVPAAIPLSNDPTLTFTLSSITLGNPVPFIDILKPLSVAPGNTMSTFTISGAGFVQGATVNFNGTILTPEAVDISANQIVLGNVQAPAVGATAPVTVVNPNSAPSISNVAFFPVTFPSAGLTFADNPIALDNPVYLHVLADVNGDGKLDAILDYQDTSQAILTLLGNGDGTFQSPIQGPIDPGDSQLVVGDFNGDGKLDLASAGQPGITVFLGNGDGTFANGISSIPSCCTSIVPGDFNGDGILDLAAVTDVDGGALTIYLGNGDGTFRQGTSVALGGFLLGVVVGDFNGDGRLDIAILTLNLNSPSATNILLGNGDGTFQNPIVYTVGNGATSQVVGDFNRDGKLDLAVTNSTDNTVSILLGNGNGTFQPHVDYGVGSNPQPIVSGDLNGDGNLDLLVVNLNNGTLSWLLGNGDGTFQPFVTQSAQSHPVTAVALGDLNGDGRLDMITSDYDLYASGYEIFLQQLSQAMGTVSPASVAFGGQVLGTSSSLHRVSLYNTSNYQMTVTSVTTTAGFAVQTNHCMNGVKPATHCDVYVAFSPTQLGAQSGTLSFVDSGINSPQTAQLTGTGQSATTTTLSSAPNPSSFGQAVTLTATVSSTGTMPTGSVTFKKGTTSLGTASLSGGAAKLTVSTLAVGSSTIAASYGGDTANAKSTSSSLKQVVTKTSSKTVVASSVNPSTAGETVRFTATVTSPTTVPTGTVTFKDGSAVLGTESLAKGKASFSTSTLSPGSHKITVTYEGNGDTNMSTSPALVQMVQ